MELKSQTQVDQPYIDYKALKGIVAECCRILESGSGGGTGDSGRDQERSSTSPPPEPPDSVLVHLAELHQKFYKQIDDDLATALTYAQSTLSVIEVGIGDWQCQAAVCGLLFTPQQLEEASASLPFECADQSALVRLIGSFQSADDLAKGNLIEHYTHIAATLQMLLQFVEVNVTAVRKIIKKIDKKVAAEYRVQEVQTYKAQSSLCSPDLQDVVVSVVQMHSILLGLSDANVDVDVKGLVSPTSFFGPETLQLMQSVPVNGEFKELITPERQTVVLDPYARPVADTKGNMPKAHTAPATSTDGAQKGPQAARATNKQGPSNPRTESGDYGPRGRGGGGRGATGKGAGRRGNHAQGGADPPAENSGLGSKDRERNDGHSKAQFASSGSTRSGASGGSGGYGAKLSSWRNSKQHGAEPAAENVGSGTGGYAAAKLAGWHNSDQRGADLPTQNVGSGPRGQVENSRQAAPKASRRGNRGKGNVGGGGGDHVQGQVHNQGNTKCPQSFSGEDSGNRFMPMPGQQPGFIGGNTMPQTPQCMLMMVPGGWAPPYMPGFNSIGGQGCNGSNGGTGNNGLPMMGMMANMDMNMLSSLRAMPQQVLVNMNAMQQQSGGYPRGLDLRPYKQPTN